VGIGRPLAAENIKREECARAPHPPSAVFMTVSRPVSLSYSMPVYVMVCLRLLLYVYAMLMCIQIYQHILLSFMVLHRKDVCLSHTDFSFGYSVTTFELPADYSAVIGCSARHVIFLA
jgi:hypothetical protein